MKFISVFFSIAASSLLIFSLAQAQNQNYVFEDLKRLEATRELEKEYVKKLDLNKKNANDALLYMINEGFKCELSPSGSSSIVSDARIRCTAQLAEPRINCQEITITLTPTWTKEIRTREEMYAELPNERIDSLVLICPNRRSKAVSINNNENSEDISRLIKSAPKLTNGSDALRHMLTKGFSCGLRSQDETHFYLICDETRPRFKNCSYPSVEFSLHSTGITSVSSKYSNLAESTLINQKINCKTP